MEMPACLSYGFGLALQFRFLVISMNLCFGVISGCRQMMSRNTGWLNYWRPNDSSVVQTLYHVKNLQVWFMYILMGFLSIIVSKAIRMILGHYSRSILHNHDGIVTRCCLGLQIEGNFGLFLGVLRLIVFFYLILMWVN